MLRPGNAGSNKASDHIDVLRLAFAQLPGLADRRPGKRLPIGTDGAGHSHDLINWLTRQRVQYSIGYTFPAKIGPLLELIPTQVWQPAYTSDGDLRNGAWVAEVTGLLNLDGG